MALQEKMLTFLALPGVMVEPGGSRVLLQQKVLLMAVKVANVVALVVEEVSDCMEVEEGEDSLEEVVDEEVEVVAVTSGEMERMSLKKLAIWVTVK